MAGHGDTALALAKGMALVITSFEIPFKRKGKGSLYRFEILIQSTEVSRKAVEAEPCDRCRLSGTYLVNEPQSYLNATVFSSRVGQN